MARQSRASRTTVEKGSRTKRLPPQRVELTVELDVVMIQFACIPRLHEMNNLFNWLFEIRLRNGNRCPIHTEQDALEKPKLRERYAGVGWTKRELFMEEIITYQIDPLDFLPGEPDLKGAVYFSNRDPLTVDDQGWFAR